jgi:hypothetical protein
VDMVGRPPCATWSVARWRRLVEGGPQPLKFVLGPWGVEGLSRRQQAQVEVGSFLYRATIRLFCVLMVSGGHALVEHPAPPPGSPVVLVRGTCRRLWRWSPTPRPKPWCSTSASTASLRKNQQNCWRYACPHCRGAC